MAFDAGAVEKLGWRQGAVLGPNLARAARDRAPPGVNPNENDWLIVTSHDCDVVNEKLEKEPSVELLRAEIVERKAPEKHVAWGRNPRNLQIEVADGGNTVVLSCRVHDRWSIPRELLATEAPTAGLPDKTRRLVAEWLAKRYLRAAFPTVFDARWRAKLREWTGLLEKHSRWVQGVYLRLNTLAELPGERPYRCHLIVAVPAALRKDASWPNKRDELENEISAFWRPFDPGIKCDGVEVLGTDEVTLADIEPYQRFDADWVSFADDSPATPPIADMRT